MLLLIHVDSKAASKSLKPVKAKSTSFDAFAPVNSVMTIPLFRMQNDDIRTYFRR